MEFAKSLRRHVAPVKDRNAPRDLWPTMRARIESRNLNFSWLDAALGALALLLCLLSPQTVLILFAHL
jgi:hypothetical protein